MRQSKNLQKNIERDFRAIASFSELGATESLNMAKSLIYTEEMGFDSAVVVKEGFELDQVKRACDEFGIEVMPVDE